MNFVDTEFLDFNKTFDKIYFKLLYKIKLIGINCNLVEWIRNWMIGQNQRVQLNKVQSDWIKVESRVPQGSILRPLLFILYLQDIEEGLASKIFGFTDDVKIVKLIGNLNDDFKLQKDLEKMMGWAEKWDMN